MNQIYILSFVLLFLGLTLVVLTGRSLWQGRENMDKTGYNGNGTHVDYLNYLQQIDRKLEDFNRDLEALKAEVATGNSTQETEKFTEKFSQILTQNEKIEEKTEPNAFKGVEEEDLSTPLSLKDKIYIEYKKGKGITELAKEFGKGKGEIELILNLRR